MGLMISISEEGNPEDRSVIGGSAAIYDLVAHVAEATKADRPDIHSVAFGPIDVGLVDFARLNAEQFRVVHGLAIEGHRDFLTTPLAAESNLRALWARFLDLMSNDDRLEADESSSGTPRRSLA